MHFLDRLERRFGAWSIPQLPLMIVMANGVIYLLAKARPEFLYRLLLDPEAIRQGEFWRLVTFLFVPPDFGLFWMAFGLLFLYQIAQALEQEWGEFRFGVFYGIGAIATIVSAMWIAGETLSNIPLNTTLLLAFATLYPDYELLLFFVLPLKIKYLAGFIWAGLAWSLVMGSFTTRVSIAASLVNYALFFGPQLWTSAKLKIEVYKNRRRFR